MKKALSTSALRMSFSWSAFLKCGMRMGLRLCANAHRKKSDVTSAMAVRWDALLMVTNRFF